jgi:hypothetical protein
MKKLEDFKKLVPNTDKFTWGKGDITIEPTNPNPEINHDKFSWKVGDLVVEPEKKVKKASNKFTWEAGDLTVEPKKD